MIVVITLRKSWVRVKDQIGISYGHSASKNVWLHLTVSTSAYLLAMF